MKNERTTNKTKTKTNKKGGSKTLKKTIPEIKKSTCSSSSKKNDIEKKVHQIWFGGPVPAWRKQIFEKNREICKKEGYKYNLWIESDRIEDNFPITFEYQQMCINIGKNIGKNRFAQVADLARLEIIYTYGGIYLDSLFEISSEFLSTVINLPSKITFIGSNEDPCGFNCKGYKGKHYLTNSFFGATKKHQVLGKLLTNEKLDKIDYESEYINRTTGPYYLASSITEEDKPHIHLFDTEDIYPFNVNSSEYRDVHPNPCISKTNVEGNKIKVKENQYLDINCIEKQRKPLLIYQSGLGGTWSW